MSGVKPEDDDNVAAAESTNNTNSSNSTRLEGAHDVASYLPENRDYSNRIDRDFAMCAV